MLRLLFSTLTAFLIVLVWPVTADDPPIPEDTDVQTTESGLKYSVLKPGTGKDHPAPDDIVTVHYTGWLESGKVFDSSTKTGQPFTTALNRVIPGWTEGVGLMTEGAVYKLTIPSKLGYGSRGAGGVIPPDATLIFEIELLAIVRMPEYNDGDAEKQKTTSSGLVYETIKPAADPQSKTPEIGHIVDLKFAMWTGKEEKVLRQCTEQMGRTLKMKVSDLRPAVLQEAAKLLRLGERMRFEATPKQYFGANAGPQHEAQGNIVFELELVQLLLPLPLPEFSLPSAAELTKTESGLQYQVLKEGSGEGSPVMGQGVKVHYAGWLRDGTNFDSSFSRAEPSTFLVGQVIQGWNEGLQLMNPGDVYKFVIPSELAYGKRGRPSIPPDSDLIFYVELIEILD